MSFLGKCARSPDVKHASKPIKIMVVGDQKVGKSASILRYIGKRFPDTYIPTKCDIYPADMRLIVNGKIQTINLVIHDTSGDLQHINDNINLLTLKDTDIIIVMFDVTNENTIKSAVDNWLPAIKSFSTKIPIIFCGSQLDLRETKTVLENEFSPNRPSIAHRVNKNFIKPKLQRLVNNPCIIGSGNTPLQLFGETNLEKTYMQAASCASLGYKFGSSMASHMKKHQPIERRLTALAHETQEKHVKISRSKTCGHKNGEISYFGKVKSLPVRTVEEQPTPRSKSKRTSLIYSYPFAKKEKKPGESNSEGYGYKKQKSSGDAAYFSSIIRKVSLKLSKSNPCRNEGQEPVSAVTCKHDILEPEDTASVGEEGAGDQGLQISRCQSGEILDGKTITSETKSIYEMLKEETQPTNLYDFASKKSTSPPTPPPKLRKESRDTLPSIIIQQHINLTEDGNISHRFSQSIHVSDGQTISSLNSNQFSTRTVVSRPNLINKITVQRQSVAESPTLPFNNRETLTLDSKKNSSSINSLASRRSQKSYSHSHHYESPIHTYSCGPKIYRNKKSSASTSSSPKMNSIKFNEAMAVALDVNDYIEISAQFQINIDDLFRQAGYLGYLYSKNLFVPKLSDVGSRRKTGVIRFMKNSIKRSSFINSMNNLDTVIDRSKSTHL